MREGTPGTDREGRVLRVAAGEGTSNIERPTSNVKVESSPAAGWPMVGDDSERDAPWDGLRRDGAATWAGFHSRVDRVEGA